MKKHDLQEWEVWHFFFNGTVFQFLLHPVLILTPVLKTVESLGVLVPSVSFVVMNLLSSFEEQLW